MTNWAAEVNIIVREQGHDKIKTFNFSCFVYITIWDIQNMDLNNNFLTISSS